MLVRRPMPGESSCSPSCGTARRATARRRCPRRPMSLPPSQDPRPSPRPRRIRAIRRKKSPTSGTRRRAPARPPGPAPAPQPPGAYNGQVGAGCWPSWSTGDNSATCTCAQSRSWPLCSPRGHRSVKGGTNTPGRHGRAVTHDAQRPASGPRPDRTDGYLAWIVILCGLASSTFGMVRVSTPSRKIASTASSFRPPGRTSARRNSPRDSSLSR